MDKISLKSSLVKELASAFLKKFQSLDTSLFFLEFLYRKNQTFCAFEDGTPASSLGKCNPSSFAIFCNISNLFSLPYL